MPVLHSLAHQPSDSVPPTVMPVLHSLALQQHTLLVRAALADSAVQPVSIYAGAHYLTIVEDEHVKAA